jgi:peptide/nickel transport system permease protein
VRRADGHGREVAGVKRELMEEFSSRRQSISALTARLAAEFENYKRRVAREREEWMQIAADRAIGALTLLGLSVPNFALGPVLTLVFSIGFGWLPVSGRGGISHLILPAVTLGAALAAIMTRMVRGAMIEELSGDYVRTARAKGLSERAVLYRHAFPNALVPILTILGLQFGALLAGTIVTESIFAWPGIGRLTVQAIQARDYPLLQGCILAIALSYVIVNLLTDFTYALVDPRIRLS